MQTETLHAEQVEQRRAPRPVLDRANEDVVANEQWISADSHFGEPLNLWESRLPAKLRDTAIRYPKLALYQTSHHLRAGAWDPVERLKDQALDGTSAEVLYPTLGADAFKLDDPELQQVYTHAYNDWVIEFCAVAPQRFWGQAMVPLDDVDWGVQELERCIAAGLRGATIRLAPPEGLPYSSAHYEKFWAAAESLHVPVSMHINAGIRGRNPQGLMPWPAYQHKVDCLLTLGDIVSSGVLERHPDLHLIFAEAGCGWLPFFTQEYDYYITGPGSRGPSPIPKAPSQYIYGQVFATFVSDPVGATLAADYGTGCFLWSSDYPHPACSWPDSRSVIAQDLGHLSKEDRSRILSRNVAMLYNRGQLPPPADPKPTDHQSLDTWERSLRTPPPRQLA